MPRAVPKVQMMEAKVAVVVNVGGRPPVYETRVVRDRKSGALAESRCTSFRPSTPAT
jgi:hypothetical protein